jgi:tetratricopeptide (TPR) repeat protein
VNNFNRPWSGSYGGWYHGGWGGWARYPAAWGALAGAALTPWAIGGAFEYANPYYEEPLATIELPPVLDYSQPIAVPTAEEVGNTDEAIVGDSMDYFTQARSSFKSSKYTEATAETERALKLLPGDRTIHEFRALCLFARKRYQEAAAALYAVLAAGPGWDWKTMSALYPNNDTYTQQLRALERYVNENRKDAKGRFLLGYHYMVLNERDTARDQFRLAVERQPKDKLSAQLAEALAEKAPAGSSGGRE